MSLMRLDKFLAETGVGTRSEVKKILKSNAVTVNGQTERRPERKIDTERDEIACRGRVILYEPFIALMLNKPAGCVTATEDRIHRTVMDWICHPAKDRLFPVGRLDLDTEGLLLLVNDGELAHRLLSPKHHAEKTYYVRVEGRLTAQEVHAFEEGIDIGEKRKTLPARLSVLESGDVSEAEVTLYEGKFHQVKRMFLACGCRVIYLKRISMAGISLDPELTTGQWRALTPEECRKLKEG